MKGIFCVVMGVIGTLLATMAIDAGHAWMSVGYGLHPLIAGVVACVALTVPFMVAWRLDD